MGIGVIFDSDGVIVDSEHQSLEAFRQAIAEQGIILNEEDLWACCGLTDRSIIEQLQTRYQRVIDLPAFTKRKFELYFDLAGKSLSVFPGVTRLLDELDSEGIPFALASSGPRVKIEFNLKKVGLLGRFDVIVSGEDVVESKPAPFIFLRTASLIHRRPQDCVVIEDSPNGLLGARRADMVAIGLRTTFQNNTVLKEAHIIFDSIEEIDVSLLRETLRKFRTKSIS